MGISPPRLTVDHMAKNVEYKKTFVLSHGDHSEAKYLRVMVDDSLKEWVTTDKGMEFSWPHASEGGEKQFPLTLIVKAPSDAANGTYSGTIRIINSSDPYVSAEENGAGASVSLAVAIEANLTLTDEQVLDYEVHSIKAAHEVEEDSPYEFVMHLENKGNVKAKPTKVEVDFYDQFNQQKLEAQETTDYGSVEPFVQDGEIVASVPHSLKIGHYWARVMVFKDNDMIKEDDVKIEVVPVGSLAKQGSLKQLTNDPSVDPGSVLKVTGDFENAGKVGVFAKLVVEVYKGDSLIEVLESDKRSVAMGQTEALEVFFAPEERGEYRLEGKVEYSGKVTPTVESTVVVGAVIAKPMLSKVVIAGAAILLAIIIALIIFLSFRRKKAMAELKSETLRDGGNELSQEYEEGKSTGNDVEGKKKNDESHRIN